MKATAPSIPPIEQFTGLIFQQALYCWRRLPPHAKPMWSVDDLAQEGAIAYAYFATRYDPGRGCKFITGFTLTLQRKLGDILQGAHRRAVTIQWVETDNEDSVAFEELAEAPNEGENALESLSGRVSREAWAAARAVLDAPAEFREYARTAPPMPLLTLVFRWMGLAPADRRRVRRELARALGRAANS